MQKAAAMGNCWLAASAWQRTCLYIMSHATCLAQHQITHMTQFRCIPDLVPCNFWLFSKLKSPFEREGISDCQWVSGKCNREADGDWKNCVRSQGAYFEGDWGIIVLCTVFLVSCIFFNKCPRFSYYVAVYFLERPHTYVFLLINSVFKGRLIVVKMAC